MRELRELVLPLMVEAKERQSLYAERERTPERPMARLRSRSHSSLGTAASSGASTPLSPVFTPRSHGRFPSGASSLAASPTLRQSLDGFGAKRPLTEVREEPTDGARDTDGFDAPIAAPRRRAAIPLHASSSPVAGSPDGASRSRVGSAAMITGSFDGPNPAAERCLDAAAEAHELAASYDWMDRMYDLDDFDFSAAKRRRGDDAPLGARLRTLSRRFRPRKDTRTPSLPDAGSEVGSRSRASSMRTTSIIDFRTDGSISRDAPCLPTPNASFVVEPTESATPDAPRMEMDEDDDAMDAASTATRTPLLPPMLVPLQQQDEEMTSPLQSPKIAAAGSPDASSPRIAHNLPSPPLSTKVSIASFHRRTVAGGSGECDLLRSDSSSATVSRPAVSTSDIPPILLAQPPDEWSQKLGHANFTIHPEPYHLGPNPTQAMLQALASDWALARRHFAQHLASTGEHYGASSKVHALTRLKWQAVEAEWRAAYQAALVQLPPTPVEQHPAMQAQAQALQPSPALGHSFSMTGSALTYTPVLISGLTAKDGALVAVAPLAARAPGSTMSMPPLVVPAASAAAVAALPSQACASRAFIRAQCDVKFPQISLEDVVGPMDRIPQRVPPSPPRSSRKRAFWRFLQGILPSENGQRRREAVY